MKGNDTVSEFNSYAMKIDELARKAFGEYEAAAAGLKKAGTAQEEFPQRMGGTMISAEQAAKRARAQADYLEAQEKMRRVKCDMDAYNDEVAAVRRDLAQEIDTAFVVDPARVDTAALELMKSGICGASDYERLLRDATSTSNATMIRLIASYAAKAADALREANGSVPLDLKETWARLHVIGEQGVAYTSRDKLAKFDALADVFKRTMRNPGMISHWDSLAGPIIENF